MKSEKKYSLAVRKLLVKGYREGAAEDLAISKDFENIEDGANEDCDE